MWLYIDVAANLVTAAVCIWAVMSRKVNDGVIGKLAFMFLCYASLSNAAWEWGHVNDLDRSEAIANVAVALVAIRCFWIRRMWSGARKWFRRVK